MGDFYQKLVPIPVSKAEATAVAQHLLQYLIQRGIILADPVDNVMDSEAGYPPGPHFIEAVEKDPAPGLLKQTTNGVEVALGRNVFWADEPKAVNCPTCGHNMVRKKWEQAIDAWYRQSGGELLTCESCGQAHSVVEYEFVPTWAFGELGVTFWNWPPFRAEFVAELAEHLGKELRIVNGQH